MTPSKQKEMSLLKEDIKDKVDTNTLNDLLSGAHASFAHGDPPAAKLEVTLPGVLFSDPQLWTRRISS